MNNVSAEEIARWRSQVGPSFATVARGALEREANEEDHWCVFSGLSFLPSNRLCIFKNAPETVTNYERYMEERNILASGLVAAEAKSIKLSEKWTPRGSTPFMAFDLDSLSEEDLKRMVDTRVYVAKSADYERVAMCLVKSFDMKPEHLPLSPFTNAARIADTLDECKIFVVDDGGEIASIVYSVTVGDSSVLLAMGTIPASRRKGLARAVLHASFIDAKQQGLKRSLLYASDVGEKLYSSVGFKILEHWDMYAFNPSPPSSAS